MANIKISQDLIQELHLKKRIAFRAFAVNLALIFLVWVAIELGLFPIGMVGRLMSCTPDEAKLYVMDLLGIWKILNVVLFLVPALAMLWEAKMRARDK